LDLRCDIPSFISITNELTHAESNIVDSFEGKESYTENLGRVGINTPKFLSIEEKSEIEQMSLF
jgi:hypothetical protein